MTLPTAFNSYAQRILVDQSLAPYTYFKIGGPADFLFTAETVTDLVQVITSARQANLPFFILGGGSNLLFSDQGFRGLVILNRTSNLIINPKLPTHILVDSGVPLIKLVRFANSHALSGLAEFAGIPGTVGGAIYNNSHAPNQLISDLIYQITVLDQNSQSQVLNPKDLNFAYDFSRFQQTQDTILSVEFNLTPGNQTELDQIAKAIMLKKHAGMPIDQKCAGCIFKNLNTEQAKQLNPQNPTVSVGYYLDQLGLKGTKIGDAQVSDKHANFIINVGNATAQNVVQLTNSIKQQFKDHYHLDLELEVFFLDPFGQPKT